MNDLELEEMRLIVSDKESYKAETEQYKNAFINELTNGLGDDMKKELTSQPPKVGKIRKFFNKLWIVLH